MDISLNGAPHRFDGASLIELLAAQAIDQGKELSELTPDELTRQSPALDDEFYRLLQDGAWLETKVSEGGTSLDRVREQLQRARAALR